MNELQKIEQNVRIVWRAFELRPEPAPTLPPNGEYLNRVWSNSVYPLAEQMGVKMKLPPVQPRSRLAHEAAHWARRQERFEDYNAAVFRAFFERDADIGKTEVLVSLASDLGMETDSLKSALENNKFLESVLADEREAQMLGISGVPAFVANRQAALSGVQTIENLQKLVEYARNNSNE